MFWLSASSPLCVSLQQLGPRSSYLIISIAHLFFIGVSSSNRIPTIFSIFHFTILPGRPARFPQFSICGLSPLTFYFFLSLLSLVFFMGLTILEFLSIKVRYLSAQRQVSSVSNSSYPLNIMEVFSVRDLLIYSWLFLIGCLFSFVNFIFIASFFNEIELNLGTSIACFCVPVMIGLIVSLRLASMNALLKGIGMGIFLSLFLLLFIILDQWYPLPGLKSEIVKLRERSSSSGHLALRRVMMARRLELSNSVLFCRRDFLLCKAQKAILGITDSDTDIYVNPLPNTNQESDKGLHHDYHWWNSHHVEKQNAATTEIDDTLGPKFPMKDDDFQGLGRRNLLYNSSVNIAEAEYTVMDEDQYTRLETHHKSFTQIDSVPVIERQEGHPLMFEDEQLLECLPITNTTSKLKEAHGSFWGECGSYKTQYQLEPDVFTYIDPFTRKREDLRDTSTVWSDGLGVMRRFLVECDVQFGHYDREMQLSVDCLEGRGIGRELEFLQVMKTYGLPTWRFRSLGFIFVGVLRFEEIERILELKGNEKHSNIRTKLKSHVQ